MRHHDLAHRGLRMWPLDQTSLRHRNPCCTIHHKHAPRAQPAHRVHKNCSQSFKSLKLFFILLPHPWKHCLNPPDQPLLSVLSSIYSSRDLIWLYFQIHFSSLVLWWWKPKCVAVQQHPTTNKIPKQQTNVSLRLTPVPTYTSGYVFSHLCLHCGFKHQDSVRRKFTLIYVHVSSFLLLCVKTHFQEVRWL